MNKNKITKQITEVGSVDSDILIRINMMQYGKKSLDLLQFLLNEEGLRTGHVQIMG